jgi:arginine repressor
MPGGGTAYEIEGFAARDDESQLSAMASLVLGIREGAAIVVVHTRPGAAQAVAAMLDQARLESIIGSIAGDDTIFVVPERRVTTVTLAKTLRRLLTPESAQQR